MSWPRRRSSYGRVLPTHRWQGLTRWQRFRRALRPWLYTAALVLACTLLARRWADPAPPQSVELVSAPFTRCGPGAAANCVIDGDTIHIGTRRIRVQGIDAPEMHPPRCQQEQALGEQAADRLLALIRQGPFSLTGTDPVARDEYGRELRVLSRTRPDGSVQSFADDMVASGMARRYERGARQPWC